MKFMRNNPALKKRRRELRHRQTEVEKTFWAHVRNRQFFGIKFYRQYSIGPYILDFYCPALKLAVELDGGHHTACERRKYDAARSEYLKVQGIKVMRFWNHDVLLDIGSVLGNMMERVSPMKVTPPNLLLPQEEGPKKRERSYSPLSG